MGNYNSAKSICVNCLECENKIKTLNQTIIELHALVEIKNTSINILEQLLAKPKVLEGKASLFLEQQIYILEKFR
jgi:hypothetical protein